MNEKNLTKRITAILLIEDIGERNHELRALAANQDSRSMWPNQTIAYVAKPERKGHSISAVG